MLKFKQTVHMLTEWKTAVYLWLNNRGDRKDYCSNVQYTSLEPKMCNCLQFITIIQKPRKVIAV